MRSGAKQRQELEAFQIIIGLDTKDRVATRPTMEFIQTLSRLFWLRSTYSIMILARPQWTN